MRTSSNHAARLTDSGFSDAQASAIGETIHFAAHETVEALGERIARWHAFLALYLLAQICIVLLAALLAQAIRAPDRAVSGAVDLVPEASHERYPHRFTVNQT